MRIIGPPSAGVGDVVRNLQQMSATNIFREQMFPALWDAAVEYGIDPVGVVAQSWKETGGGTFKGQVTPQFYNTAGIKVRHVGKYPGVDDGDRPLAHAQFPNWQIGARAHVEHLRAYSGWPVAGPVVDPRYQYALRLQAPPAGVAWVETFEELGGLWAPAADYGTTLVAIARRLQGAA